VLQKSASILLGLQPETNVAPFDDMYICEVCNWTVCAIRTLAATQRGRERKFTRMTAGPALAVLTPK